MDANREDPLYQMFSISLVSQVKIFFSALPYGTSSICVLLFGLKGNI
jgi:hypothetical protein